MSSKKPVAVIGAGNSGLAMAAHLSLNGEKVRLWNRSYDNIKDLIESNTILSEGIISGETIIDYASDNLKDVLNGTDLIMVTVPANSHKNIASAMAPLLTGKELIVLNPGRTFGALEFRNVLRQNGCNKLPEIVETQTIIYTCRRTGSSSVVIYAIKNDVLIVSLNSESNSSNYKRLPACLRDHFVKAENMVQTSIGNVGMILHCAPTLFNIGWIESPRTHFKYYYEGITPTIGSFLEEMDKERVNVANFLGYEVETTKSWLKRSFDIEGKNLYECIQNNEAYKNIEAPESLMHRYIFEDIPCGLVPLEAVGIQLGLNMTNSTLVINLANKLLRIDFREKGRNLNQLGFINKKPQNLKNIIMGSRNNIG